MPTSAGEHFIPRSFTELSQHQMNVILYVANLVLSGKYNIRIIKYHILRVFHAVQNFFLTSQCVTNTEIGTTKCEVS